MKICVIGPALKMGGMERASVNLANALDNHGYVVSFISIFNQEKFLTLNPTIKIYEPGNFNLNNLSLFKTIFWLRKNIKIIQPEKIIVFNKLYSAICLLALIGTNYEVFISERSSPLYKWPIFQEWFCKIVYFFFKPDGIIAQTQIAKEYQTKYYGNKTPIKVIPNILRNVRLYPEIERKHIILVAGRLNDPLKGFDLLIEAFSLVKNQDWKVVIAGGEWGDDLYLTNLIKKHGLEKRIEFKGKILELDKLFAESSIFVMPSRSEGFPNALCEAMAAGLACISFDFIAGPRDLIENHVNGIIIKDGDIESLAKTIDYLIENPVVRLNLGRESEKIIEKLSPKTIMTKIIDFLHEIK